MKNKTTKEGEMSISEINHDMITNGNEFIFEDTNKRKPSKINYSWRSRIRHDEEEERTPITIEDKLMNAIFAHHLADFKGTYIISIDYGTITVKEVEDANRNGIDD